MYLAPKYSLSSNVRLADYYFHGRGFGPSLIVTITIGFEHPKDKRNSILFYRSLCFFYNSIAKSD